MKTPSVPSVKKFPKAHVMARIQALSTECSKVKGVVTKEIGFGHAAIWMVEAEASLIKALAHIQAIK